MRSGGIKADVTVSGTGEGSVANRYRGGYLCCLGDPLWKERQEMTTIHTPPCVQCGQPGTVELSDVDEQVFKHGKGLIQDDLAHLSPGVREQLMTGTHPACWDAMIGDGERLSIEEAWEVIYTAEQLAIVSDLSPLDCVKAVLSMMDIMEEPE
jgi:hypothetical protein